VTRCRNTKGNAMEDRAELDVRCSVIIFRDDSVLLVHRARDGADDWVLPGGAPRAGESMAACARRETLEETGLSAEPARVAFVLEALGPQGGRRMVDLVFLALDPVRGEPDAQEEGMEARFVSLRALSDLLLRPPLAGHLRALHPGGRARTAAYLGNLWRPDRSDGMSWALDPSRQGVVG
jgi:8-oxo-dGTP diphosphatase